VCTGGDGKPGGYAEALAMLASGLDYLNGAAAGGEIAEPALGEVLLGLEAVGARHAAARALVLSRFDAADCHDSNGYQNSSSWLRDKAGMTGPAARKYVKQMRTLRSRPRIAEAMGEGWLSQSYADRIIAWTKPVPADMLDTTDQLIVSVLWAPRHPQRGAPADPRTRHPRPGDHPWSRASPCLRSGRGSAERPLRLRLTRSRAFLRPGAVTGG
jgi:hypothetical protein